MSNPLQLATPVQVLEAKRDRIRDLMKSQGFTPSQIEYTIWNAWPGTVDEILALLESWHQTILRLAVWATTGVMFGFALVLGMAKWVMR